MKLKITPTISYCLLWIGLISGGIIGFFQWKVGSVLIGAALIQLFIFCICPHCGYGLYNVSGLPNCCPNCGEPL